MGTPLIENEGISNVVPAFRKAFPDALLLADMKTMDGGGFEAGAMYAGGGNIVDFLALAGVDYLAKAMYPRRRDEFRKASADLARLVFADILVPHQGPAAQAVDVARRMIEAGVDGVGIHLPSPMRAAPIPVPHREALPGIACEPMFEGIGGAERTVWWSAASPSHGRRASARSACGSSSSAAISASRTAAPATTCTRTESRATSPASSAKSPAPESRRHSAWVSGTGQPSGAAGRPRSAAMARTSAGQRTSRHLAHHLAPMRLDGDLADAEFTADLLVQQTRDHQAHHLLFARRERL